MALSETALAYCQKPSPWVRRWASAFPRSGPIVDLACGGGRHSAYLALMGYEVIAADMDTRSVASLSALEEVSVLCVDLENAPWPFAPNALAGMVVTNYLVRAHFPLYFESLAPGGLFVMETFTEANKRRWGHPRREAHYLKEGELYRLMPSQANLLGYEEVETSVGTFVARIAWRKP